MTRLGANVNLGNVAPADVIGVETLRLGLRSDTFSNYDGATRDEAGQGVAAFAHPLDAVREVRVA